MFDRLSNPNHTYTTMHKLDILAFAAHPDDVELSAAGTLLSHAAQGKKVGIVDMTRGELGTRGSADLRDKEAEAAGKILGLSVRTNLRFADGFFTHDQEHLIPLIEILRLFRPEIVLCNAIQDRHPDHGRGAKLQADACFLSGLPKIETSWDGVPQDSWRPKAVYHYIQDFNLEPDFVVDISKYMDKKLEAIMAFGSQFYDPSSSEPATPISGIDFMEFVKSKGRTYGRHAGFEFGEAFTVARPVGIKSLFDLS